MKLVASHLTSYNNQPTTYLSDTFTYPVCKVGKYELFATTEDINKRFVTGKVHIDHLRPAK